MIYDTRDCGRISSVTGSNDFIMQNHFVKKRVTLLYSTNRIIKTRKEISIFFFCLNIFKSYRTIYDIMLFAD
jgi:hypothetical protein